MLISVLQLNLFITWIGFNENLVLKFKQKGNDCFNTKMHCRKLCSNEENFEITTKSLTNLQKIS